MDGVLSCGVFQYCNRIVLMSCCVLFPLISDNKHNDILTIIHLNMSGEGLWRERRDKYGGIEAIMGAKGGKRPKGDRFIIRNPLTPYIIFSLDDLLSSICCSRQLSCSLHHLQTMATQRDFHGDSG